LHGIHLQLFGFVVSLTPSPVPFHPSLVAQLLAGLGLLSLLAWRRKRASTVAIVA
jgi:hypothetical protein